MSFRPIDIQRSFIFLGALRENDGAEDMDMRIDSQEADSRSSASEKTSKDIPVNDEAGN